MKYVAKLKVDNNVLIHGDGCVTTLSELYKVLVDKETTELEITRDFANKYFTYSGLCDFVEQSSAVAPNVRLYVDDFLYDNTLNVVKDIMLYTTPEAFVYAVEHNPSRVISTIQELCKSYIGVHEEASIANAKISNMLVQIDDLQRQLKYSKQDYEKLAVLRNDLESKLHAIVNRVNFRYEKTVNPDTMFVSKHNSYKHILYIKEITRVHYTDTLLYYLQQILRTLYSMPVRTVAIEPYYAFGSEERYPDFIPHWKLTYRDVYSGDILMAGYQPKLMNDILCNSNHINFLIVLDRGGYMTPHIEGNNVSYVYCASDVKDLPKDYKDAITYSDETMYIPYVEGFESMSPEKKLQVYSSMPIIQRLTSLLEEVH